MIRPSGDSTRSSQFLRRTSLLVVVLLILASWFTPTHTASAGTFEVNDLDEMTSLMLRIRADQFLRRATFGPTESEIQALADRMATEGVRGAAEEWIDNQFDLPATSHVETAEAMAAADGHRLDAEGVYIQRYRYHSFWHIALAGEDQLRQRIAWALSQIVVTSEDGAGFGNRGFDNNGKIDWLGPTAYYDMLVENADDTYRELLGDVTFHPVMGTYLSHLRNRKADPEAGRFPDENYAREIMQLFSIGLYELNRDGTFKRDGEGELIPTYDNDDIKEFARLFTGLGWAGSTRIWNGRRDLYNPMKMHNNEHDQGPKTLLRGETLPATEDGVADINAGLDSLYSHPNVAPFISRLLIQRLVRSNPSTSYISRVARVFEDNGSGVRGDLREVVKAILLDREAWNSIVMRRRSGPFRLEVRPGGTERSRVLEPVLLYSGFLRRFATGSEKRVGNVPEGGEDVRTPLDFYLVPAMDYDFTQAPYKSPTVFNFYSPNFQPSGPIPGYRPSRRIPNGDIFVPELELFTSVMANRMANRIRWDIMNDECEYWLARINGDVHRSFIKMDYSRERELAVDPQALAEHLDLTLCSGTMSNALREALAEAIGDVPANNANNIDNRVAGALLSVLMSPAHMISE